MITDLHVRKAFRTLRAAGYKPPPTNELADAVELWADILSKFDPQELEAAVVKYAARDTPWFPKPGQIKALILFGRPARAHKEEPSGGPRLTSSEVRAIWEAEGIDLPGGAS